MEDWYWASHEIPILNWNCDEEKEDANVVIVPTGPSDERPSFQLLVAEAANTSREKLWIASPYFVPDDGILTALQAARFAWGGRSHSPSREAGSHPRLAFLLHLLPPDLAVWNSGVSLLRRLHAPESLLD